MFFLTLSEPYEKSKCLGSGGTLVARLKHKEIEGRAPQGADPTIRRLKKALSILPMSGPGEISSVESN